jgi:hypothetical protein
MLYNLISLLSLGLCCLGGSAVFRSPSLALSWRLMLGLLVLGISVQMLAFFSPINHACEIVAIGLGLLGCLYLWRKNALPKIDGLFWPMILFTAFLAAYAPFIYDHFGYYVPSILYLDHYPLLPGLGNVELNYAQMSPWHMLQTLFSHYLDPYLRLNQLVFLMFMMFIYEQKKYILALCLPIFVLFLHSPSPDLPAYALALMILSESLAQKTPKQALALAILVASIKPSLFWLPMFLLMKQLGFDQKTSYKVYILPVLLVGIYLFKNLYLFGFPIFPMQVCDFNLPWKPHPEILKRSAEVAILKTYDAQYTVAQIKAFSTGQAIKNWLFLRGVKSYIHISFLLLWLLWMRWLWQQKSALYLCLGICVGLKTVVVLCFSAQYRFFIDAEMLMIYLMFQDQIKAQVAKLSSAFLLVITVLILSCPKFLQKQIPSFQVGHMMQGFSASQLLKPQSFAHGQYQSFTKGNFTYHQVKDYPFSFDTPMMAIAPAQLQLLAKIGIFPQWEEGVFGKQIVWKLQK